MDPAHVQVILGVVLLAYAIYGLLFRLPIGKVGGPWAYFFGFFAGGLGGAISASGPPVIVYTSIQAWTKDQIKVTLSPSRPCWRAPGWGRCSTGSSKRKDTGGSCSSCWALSGCLRL